MKVKHILIIAIAVLFALPSLQAQVVDRTINRTKRRVESRTQREVDRGVDRAIDEGINAVFGKKNKKKKNKDKDANAGNTPDDNTHVIIEEDDTPGDNTPNQFVGSFRFEMIEKKDGEVTKNGESAIQFYMNEYQTAYLPEMEETQDKETIMVFDKRDRVTTIKTNDNGSKTAMKMKMPKVTTNGGSDQENYSVTETGDTKYIEGYFCKKYLVESDDTYAEVWVTENFGVTWSQLAGFMTVKTPGSKSNGKGPKLGLVNGMVLESHSKEKNGNKTHDLYIRDINKGFGNDHIFSTDGYNVTDMTGMGY